ncbi:polysaccharide biosynthesis C-terminal domain-containing protein [Shinella sumterensis]|uniref:NAD-dependent epimerase/dehydratase family protein n=1 Tax=Shinella sumterensis TaxID=1967501 RepID=A0AA50CJ92_9HYPH|nr:NAD-dependent epimerase/dehydratase family protein [Shinella sumterensis]WLR96201.1 NAD-dependent epimerase/dehydratase family protein [Shinella sumterensis]
MKKMVLTGAAGLLGWHTRVRLHAHNCAARFSGEPEPFDIFALDREGFNDDQTLASAIAGADVILHFAGVNRGNPESVEQANKAIAHRLVAACQRVASKPHIVYANSIHAGLDTPYGRSKKAAEEIIRSFDPTFANLLLSHVFGEFARPDYNNVTATFIDRIIHGNESSIAAGGVVHLIHAGQVARDAIEVGLARTSGDIHFQARQINVPELYEKILSFGRDYRGAIIPELHDPFEVQLFNSFRAALFPSRTPNPLHLSTDHRGVLFEAVKTVGGGQTFLSWTEPGGTRGNHFHLQKVERFLVLQGEAKIRIRRVLNSEVHAFDVSGSAPAVVDIPTLHAHSIENTGSGPLLTLFWANEIFDPNSPDTYADPVLAE